MSGKIFSMATTPSWKIAVRLWIASLASAVAALFRASANRRAVMSLRAMDDRMLKDIGLTRADVDGALSQPLHKDPSRILMVRRVERRATAPARLSPGEAPVLRRLQAACR